MDAPKKTALVLGGTAAHISLIENLKQRGYHTILVDYLPNPIAKPYADAHIQESGFDTDVVLRIAQGHNADLVISTNLDFANVVACEVGEKLGLPIPYSSETARYSTQKDLMKERMTAFDIPTSRYVVGNCYEDVSNHQLRYPVMVKPVDRSGGFGVYKVSNPGDTPYYFQKALDESGIGRALIEEFVEGEQVSIDCFVQNGRAEVLLVRNARVNKNKNAYYGLTYGAIIPADISEKAKDAAKDVVKKIVAAFSLHTTFFLIQAIVNQDNVNVIEVALRVGGGASNVIISTACSFDPIDAMVSSYLNLPIKHAAKRGGMPYLCRTLYARGGVFHKIAGHEELLDEGVIAEFRCVKPHGAVIEPNSGTKHRVAYFLTSGDTLEEAFTKEEYALGKIEAYDDKGKPMMVNEQFDSMCCIS